MFARLAVASNALTSPGLPVHVANLIHTTLLDQINAHGRLVFSNDPEVSALLRAVKSGEGIPQDARTRWIETLTRLHKHGRIRVLHGHTPLADITELVALRDDWGSCADVAVVASEACEALGIPIDTGLVTDPGARPDVAITSAATSSPAMRRLRNLADVGIAAPGSSREDFWHQVLEPIATDARSVTVLDAYLFSATWDIAKGVARARHWSSEQLAWLLQRLDAVMAQSAEIQLIGSAPKDHRGLAAEETAQAIQDRWKPPSHGRLKTVRISLAKTQKGERFPHDRHIRFSSGGAIEISAGLDRLRDDTIWDPDGMKWKYIWNIATLRSLQEAEMRAKSYARHSTASVLER